MSRMMWKKQLIGGTSNSAAAIEYDPADSSRATTNVESELDRLNQNLTEKIDTDSGTFEDAELNTYTGVTVDMISYDSTNEQLLLKVNGADSVLPFKKGDNYSKRVLYIGYYVRGVTDGYCSFDLTNGICYTATQTRNLTGIVADVLSNVGNGKITVKSGVHVSGAYNPDYDGTTGAAIVDEVLDSAKTYTFTGDRGSASFLLEI